MIENDPTYNFIPEVYIVESAHFPDYIEGRQEGKALQASLNIMGIPSFYFPIFTKDGFKYILDQVNPSHYYNEDKTNNTVTFTVPVLHISAHGANDCFELTDGAVINWQELRSIMAPVNSKCNSCLVLCMSVCHGLMAFRSAQTLRPTDIPFFQLIGPQGNVLWQDALLAFLVFYRRFELLVQDKSDQLKTIMNTTISQNLFDIINGTDVQSDYHERVMTIARNLVQNRNQAKNSH